MLLQTYLSGRLLRDQLKEETKLGRHAREAIYPASDRAFVRQEPGYPALMLRTGSTDECGVIDKAVLVQSQRILNSYARSTHAFGVLPFVFKARKSAFSAPRICTVEAGYLARLVRDPL